MTEKIAKPQLRFAGFDDTWEQRKLGKHSEIVAGGTPNTAHSEYWNPKEIPWMSSGEINKKVIYTTDNMISKIGFSNSSAKWVKEKSVLIALAGQGKTRGTVAITEISLTTNQSIAAIQPDDSLYYKYLFQNLKGRYDELRNISSGDGTRGGLNKQIISDLIVLAPDMNEQRKIGDFLCNLDNLITLHQRKYDKLTNVKKSMLEKMFPKNGSNVPEIRFKGFSDAWEQRKVGELLIERNEQAPMNEEYPLMAFIANEGVAPKGERYDRSSLVTDTENKLYKRTEFGDFIYSSNNLETGSIGLNKYGKACISPVYSVFHPTGIADSNFLGRRLVRKDFINSMVKWRQGVIYGQWRIHESDFLKIDIPVPSVEEQIQIGTFLDYLDNLITLHQRELEKLKNLKKACLEKMFV